MNPRRTRRITKIIFYYCYPLCSFFIVGWFIFLASCAFFQPVSKQTEKKRKPRLELRELTYNFGYAEPGVKITHTFGFMNSGGEPLKIEKIKTDCGCTAALLSAEEISPGDDGSIRAVFQTRQYEGKQQTIITIHSNDPSQPEIDLIIQGTVKRGLVLVPQGINFGKVTRGRAIKKRVQVYQLSRETLVLNKIEANENYITVKTSRFREENSRGINIDVTLKAEVPVGDLIEVITLFTNHKKYPKIDIPVLAKVTE